MDESDSVGEIPPWLLKRKKTEKCVSTRYTEQQCAELEKIISLYTFICYQYDSGRKDKSYRLFFLLREKCPYFFELGFFPITDFRYWQSLLNSNSPFFASLQTIIGHLCAAQLSVKERLKVQGHSYDPSTMIFEEIKSWAMNISQLKILGMPLRDELNARKLFFSEASSHPALFKDVPEYAEAVYKCGVVVESEMLPCLNAVLTQYFVQKPFLLFKQSMLDLLQGLFKFIFHLFCDKEYVEGKWDIKTLQNPTLRGSEVIGTECEATVSGKILLKLITLPIMQEVFQSDFQRTVSGKQLCENIFNSEESNDLSAKEWGVGSGKNTPFGVLAVFKEDPKLMQQFMRLHALTQKMAIFYIVFKTFAELKQDCRYVLKEMREVIQHYKFLHSEISKCIRELYVKAGNYFVKAKYSKGTESWQRHFSEVRNSYDGLMKNLSLPLGAVYELEKMYAEIEPILPLNQVRESLEKLLELMGYFTEQLKSSPAHGESRDLLLSPSTPQRVNSAPGSRVGTPAKK